MVTERVDIIVRERGARVVKRSLAGIGTTAKASAVNVNLLKKSLLGISALVVGRAVFNQLRQFGQAMSTVKAITGATAEEFGRLQSKARELGATTRFTATQAGEGLVFLARTGFDTAQSLATIGPVLDLALAGALDLGRAADLTTNVLKGFRLEADQMTRVVDVMAAASNSANTSVEQLGVAMSFVAPIAAGFGISMEETAAAIGVMSDAGIQGDRAGTGLRRVISELEAPSVKSANIIRRLGLTLEEVKPSGVGLTQALRNLRNAGADAGVGMQIFKQRGGPAFEVMAAGVEQLDKLNGRFVKAGGTAKEMARIMNDNLNGAFFELVSALQELAFAINESFLGDTLKNALQAFTFILRGISERMGEIKVIAIATGIVLAIAFRANIIERFNIEIIRLRIGMLTLNSAIALNPFVALGIAIAAVIAALVFFSDDITILSDGITTLGDVGRAAWGFIADGISTVIDFVGELIPEFLKFDDIWESIRSGLGSIVTFMIGVFDVIVLWPLTLFKVAKRVFKALPDAIQDGVKKAANIMIDGFNGAISQIIKGINLIPFIGGVDTPQFEKFKINSKASGEGIGEAFINGIIESINTGPLAGALDAILKRAKKGAEARRNAGITSGGFDEGVIIDDVTSKIKKQAGAQALRAGFIKEVNKSLDEEIRLLTLSNEEREVERRVLSLIEKAKEKNITLSKKEIADFRARFKEIQKMNDEVERQEQLFDSIQGPLKNYNLNLEALNQLLLDGKINSEQFTTASDKLRLQFLGNVNTLSSGVERGMLRIKDQFTDVSGAAETAFVNAFQGMENALNEFVDNGTFNFKTFVDQLQKDITRLAIRMAILKPLAEGFTAGSGPSGGGGGFSLLGTIGSLAGSFFGGGGGNSGTGGVLDGFATGGSFIVGGAGGTDSQTVGFRATPGEKVTVTPQSETTGESQRPIQVVINVQGVQDPAAFRRSEGQIGSRAGIAIQRHMGRNA